MIPLTKRQYEAHQYILKYAKGFETPFKWHDFQYVCGYSGCMKNALVKKGVLSIDEKTNMVELKQVSVCINSSNKRIRDPLFDFSENSRLTTQIILGWPFSKLGE